MIFALLLHRSAGFHVAFDLGSQYIKILSSDGAGYSNPVNLRRHSHLIPSAAAIKVASEERFNDSEESLYNTPFLVGSNAVKQAKRHPEFGSRFLGRTIGRNHSEMFQIPSKIRSDVLLGLLLSDLVSDIEMGGMEGAVVVVPTHFTFSQRDAILSSFWAAKIPFYGAIEDTHAVSHLYASLFEPELQKQNRTVMFIDIGATKVSAYSVFFYVNESVFCNQTSYFWNESLGTHILASSISKYRQISLSKAENLLLSTDSIKSCITSDLSRLHSFISVSLNQDVTEIQVIGGGQKLPFVLDTIKQAAKEIPVKTNLSAFDAVSMGGALLASINAPVSRTPNNIIFNPLSVYKTRVRCGEVSEYVCSDHFNCSELVILDNTICDTLELYASDETVPEGAVNSLGFFTLKNISSFEHDEDEVTSGIIECHNPLPIVSQVLWCITATISCQPIQVEDAQSDYSEQERMVRQLLKGASHRALIDKIKSELGDILDRIDIFMENNNQIADELASNAIQNFHQVYRFETDIELLKSTLEQAKERARFFNLI